MKRDTTLDAAKGLAIILVMAGHILETSVVDYKTLGLFNIIWAVQMPVFAFLSGYFCEGEGKNGRVLMRRAESYLIPFLSWFVIKVLVLGAYDRNLITAFQNLLYFPEQGLWYLWVCFVLAAALLLSIRTGKKIKKKGVFFTYLCISALFYFIVAAGCGIVYMQGRDFKFLGIKYILYYSIFYWSGWSFRYFRQIAKSWAYVKKWGGIIYSISFLVFILIICNVTLMDTKDTLLGSMPRFAAAFTGIYCILFAMGKLKERGIKRVLCIFGKNSLELYYMHIFFFELMEKKEYGFYSLQGVANVLFAALFMLFYSIVLIWCVRASKGLNFIVFGKRDRGEEYFYNTNCHLNDVGSGVRTKQLIQDIKAWKEKVRI